MAYKRQSPGPIIEGYTNATTMATQYGVNYFDGTRVVTTSAGTGGQILTSNGAAAPTFQSTAGATGKSFFGFGGGRSISDAGFNFFAPWAFSGFPQTNEQVVSPVNGIVNNLYVWVSSNGVGSPVTLTFYVNSVASSLTVTIPGSSTGLFMNTSDDVAIAVGDFIGFGSTTGAGLCVANFSVSLTV